MMFLTLRGGEEKSIVVYDDYNSNVRTDSNTIGTITTNIGSCALRNAYKLIEIHNRKRNGGLI